MNERPDFAIRRSQLLLRAGQQREELAQALAPLVAGVHSLDRAAAGMNWLRARPELLMGIAAAGGVAAVLTLASRPLRLVRLARFGATAWQTWRWARIVLRPLGGAFKYF